MGLINAKMWQEQHVSTSRLHPQLPGAHIPCPLVHPLSSSNSCAASEAPTLSSQVAGAHTVWPSLAPPSSNSHSPSETLPVGDIPIKTQALHAHFKAMTSAPMMDTLDLAHQHFYYLLLKDPFASWEWFLGLAQEAFSHAFGEKPGSQFEVSQDMLQMVRITVVFVCGD